MPDDGWEPPVYRNVVVERPADAPGLRSAFVLALLQHREGWIQVGILPDPYYLSCPVFVSASLARSLGLVDMRDPK